MLTLFSYNSNDYLLTLRVLFGLLLRLDADDDARARDDGDLLLDDDDRIPFC